VHDGFAQLAFGGNTYYGLGDYGGLDIIDQSPAPIEDTNMPPLRC